jgi:hypothetical protein
MSSSPKRAVVEHDARLDILCCLAGEPLAVEQVSGRTGRGRTHTRHHMQILDAFGLVGTKGDVKGGQVVYVGRLDEQPAWVRKAVEAHRAAR